MCPHEFLESNPLMIASISSGVVGCKKIEFIWHGGRYFLIFASLVLNGPVGVKFACAEVTEL